MQNNKKLQKLALLASSFFLFFIFLVIVLEKTRIIDIYSKPLEKPVLQLNNEDNSSEIVEQDIDVNTDITTSDTGSSYPVAQSYPDINIENEYYKITKNESGYLVTLYAIINRPEQYDSYIDDLKQYKEMALSRMKSEGVDVNQVKIVYEPNEANIL